MKLIICLTVIVIIMAVVVIAPIVREKIEDKQRRIFESGHELGMIDNLPWKAASLIARDDGLTADELTEIFGTTCYNKIFDLPIYDVINRLREYGKEI